ncbi:MAG: NADH-quinone oxidoreductase subunit J [bacterium]
MEITLFYIAGVIAVAATGLALTRANASHGLIYLIISLLAIAVIFYLIGAPFAAALEVVIYAGAIMVLFVFVIMMLNLGEEGTRSEKRQINPSMMVVPGLMALVLLFELMVVIRLDQQSTSGEMVSAKAVGLTLFGPYVLAVEIASMLLLAGLVGAYHVGRRYRLKQTDSDDQVDAGKSAGGDD